MNKVFIGQSMDGYIAGPNGELDWLESIPNPDGSDMGYHAFMQSVDALLMGRNTFEIVCGFDMEWPYQKPVFVLSNSLTEIPEEYQEKAFLVKGEIPDVLEEIQEKGFHDLYIDGGKLIQSFLRAGRIDEMTISTLPIVLGKGISLFGEVGVRTDFELISSQVHLGQIVMNHYRKKLS